MPINNTYCERETSITWPIIDRFPFILFYLDFWQQRHPFHQYKKLSWDLPNIHNRFIQYIKRKPSKEGNFADSFVSNKLSKELFHWQMFLLDSTKNYFLVLKDTLQNIKCNQRKICCCFSQRYFVYCNILDEIKKTFINNTNTMCFVFLFRNKIFLLEIEFFL